MAHLSGRVGPQPPAFRPETQRGTDGFFRAAQDEGGRWWLIDPAGEAFFVRSVNGMRHAGVPANGSLAPDSAARLRAWGFNAVGVSPEEAGRDDGLPFMATVELTQPGHHIALAGLRLPDVFDPGWERLAVARASEVCAPLADCRALIGWVTDNDLAWASPSFPGAPSLLQVCLSLEPSFAAHHAAWEFVLALHGGQLEGLARAWSVAAVNKAALRELTRAETALGTRGYLRDAARWTQEFARRYFRLAAGAVRSADSNHLVLGCRLGRRAGASVLAECVYPAIDVALANWDALPAPSARPSHPVMANDVCWAREEFWRAPAGVRPRRLTSVERMLRRGRATLDRLAAHPAVVGYAWSRWQDEPGEQPPFAGGLVHVNDAEAREHTEVLTQFNARAANLRRSAVA